YPLAVMYSASDSQLNRFPRFLLLAGRNSIAPLETRKVPQRPAWDLFTLISIAHLLPRFPSITSGRWAVAVVVLRSAFDGAAIIQSCAAQRDLSSKFLPSLWSRLGKTAAALFRASSCPQRTRGNGKL